MSSPIRSRVVAIAGAKGSPGCSFLAVALARYLAASNIATLLVDADGEGGGLSALLDVAPARSAASLARDPRDESPVQIVTHLWFAELGCASPESLNGLELAGAMRERHQAVVVDLGHSSGPLQRQLAAASDWLLWVVVPDRSGLERADKALASGLLGAANVGLVFNRIGRGSLDRADEALSNRHGIPVMARINLDRRIADLLSGVGPVDRERGVRRALRELARSVHPDAGSAAPA